MTSHTTKQRSGYLRQTDSTAFRLETRKSVIRDGHKTNQHEAAGSLESVAPLRPSRGRDKVGFKTAIKAGEPSPLPCADGDVVSGNRGIHLETTVSVRSSSKASANNSVL
jgi:hypothetical protein